MKVLFICSQGMHRSRTAEDIFSKRFETDSAGLYNEDPVTEGQLEWADLIVVMEPEHRIEIGKRFPRIYMKKKIVCLDIPDIYHYNQPELIQLLKRKMDEVIDEIK